LAARHFPRLQVSEDLRTGGLGGLGGGKVKKGLEKRNSTMLARRADRVWLGGLEGEALHLPWGGSKASRVGEKKGGKKNSNFKAALKIGPGR